MREGIKYMSEKRNDRGLLLVAKTDLDMADYALKQKDSVFINQAISHISQATEKIVKYLCSCYGIDYSYSHYIGELVDSLLEKDVKIPQLIQDSIKDYGEWATKARYSSAQLVQRSYSEKQYNCVKDWLLSIEKQIML